MLPNMLHISFPLALPRVLPIVLSLASSSFTYKPAAYLQHAVTCSWDDMHVHGCHPLLSPRHLHCTYVYTLSERGLREMGRWTFDVDE